MTDLPPARLLDVTPDEYHALPGFSSTLAKILIRQSPAHAKDAYDLRREQLAEGDEDEEITDEKRKQLDKGSIAHALVLGIGRRIEIVPRSVLSKSGSYGTDAAKAVRDAARKAGRIPVKEHDMAAHEQRAANVRARLAEAGRNLDGTSEMAIEWHEQTPDGPVQCKAMLDHVRFGSNGVDPLRKTAATIYDLKMVASAHPDACQRSAENFGYAIQAAAYKRALAALHPRLEGRISFRFLFCETSRPHALWDPERLSGAFEELGARRWRRAVNAWAHGQATGEWPAYRTPAYSEITAPMWTLKQEGFLPDDY